MSPTPRDEARLAALEHWAVAAHRAGHAVPERHQLAAVAQAGGVTPVLQRVPQVVAWERTLGWLLEQADAGVVQPHTSLPEALRRPVAAPGARPAAGGQAPPHVDGPTRADQRFVAVRDWHARATDAGTENAWQLRETHLRLVANSHVQTADEIRAIFPPVIGQFANELASALDVRGSASPSTTPEPGRGDEASTPSAGTGRTQVPTSAAPTDAPNADRATPPPSRPAEPEPEARPDPTVDAEGFAPYEFGASEGEPAALVVRRRPEGGVHVSWRGPESAEPDRVTVDRLITSDEFAPYSPDAARLVTATTATEAVDDMAFSHAARHYQVWRNTGADLDDAKLAQPVLVARGQLVSPVLELDLREDEGRVIGQWRVLPGTTRVQVFRIPVQVAAGASGDPRFRILSDELNLGGFVDTEADRGARYLYQVFAEAEFDGVARLSAPLNNEVLVSAVHRPVTDLSFELHDHEDAPLFDLSWSIPPGGQVVVYRTEQPHQPGIERQATRAAALDQAGLPVAKRLAHPITTTGQTASMRQVPWPTGWTRAYFTTVVLLGDMAFVGNTVRGVRVPRVGRPKLIERVNREILTFEWPEGADVVLAYKSMRGIDSAVAMQGQAIEVSRTDYRDRGGLEFPAGQLDVQGCDLHLVSVAFDGGARVLAEPTIVTYPGLLRIWYQVLQGSLPDGRPAVTVRVRAQQDVQHAPPFVLVHNRDRLPLTIGDGRPVAVVPEGPPTQPQRRFVPSPLGMRPSPAGTWHADPGAFLQEVPPVGFLRLFVDLPPEVLRRVALLDPPVATLRVAPRAPMGGGPGGP
ncbi:hypothetical protein F8O01_03890 [Pseudoclavibacter chungangensis]|uniref:Uncharacterized protein n=1 Tax=Pseudoclavibacter chungangensis TaxID=587635 RepID=A0A7J5BZM7_9MICO|nr:hypothetical protein [Pseudoclavibacter chungangensis]KAB1660078.1 hypothetical protein F8O01_03890 [Pseudoclavibacter chungangensis]NYJ66821.1 hypothetical protein [Pseudoclavibacter chungangensis]